MDTIVSNQSEYPLLKGVLDATQNGVIICQYISNGLSNSPELMLTMLNPVAERDLGRPAHEVLSQPFVQSFPGFEQGTFYEQGAAVCKTGQSSRFECGYNRPDKWGHLWLDVSILRLNDRTIVITYQDITQAKAAAETTRISSVYQQGFEASINGIMVLRPVMDVQNQINDFHIVMINAAALRMDNLHRSDMLSKSIWTIYPATQINGLFSQYVQVYETGQTFSGEHYYPEYDVWRKVNIVRVEDSVMITYIDITALKKADELSQKQARFMQRILEGIPVGIAVLEAVRNPEGLHNRVTDFQVVHMNAELKSILGLINQPVTGQLLSRVFAKAKESGLLSRCLLGIELTETQEFDMPYGTPDHTGWYRVSIAPMDNELILTLTDITETRQAQLMHHQQAELLSSVLDGSQNAIIAFDAVRNNAGQIVDFQYTLQNRVNQQWIGSDYSRVIGRTMLDYFPHVARNGLLGHFIDVVETGVSFQQVVRHDHADTIGWYHVSAINRRDGLVLTITDKTNEKRTQESLQANQLQLERAVAELKRSNEYLQQFAFVASHDLQEPLRKIQSLGDMLAVQTAGLISEKNSDLLSRMQHAATRMSGLIRDLLNYSRLTTQQKPFELVSLPETVQALLLDLEVTIKKSGAVIHLGTLPTLMADPVQMYQLFLNLIGNALKYRHPDQKPVVSLSCRQLDWAEVPDTQLFSTPSSDIATKTFWKITITDNGIGFDTKHLERIFGMFQRLHTKTQYEGSGMGLAICKRVIDNHQGSITAHSTPGLGSVFVVYLPA